MLAGSEFGDITMWGTDEGLREPGPPARGSLTCRLVSRGSSNRNQR